jgi:organic hydroperoxide reductase OsmC/OhrA
LSEEKTLTVELERIHYHPFKVDFGHEGMEALMTDEREPVGMGAGPNPSMLLTAAIGNCLSSSLLFCLNRAKAEVKGMKTKADAKLARNDKGRWKVTEVVVELNAHVDKEYVGQMERCISLFED